MDEKVLGQVRFGDSSTVSVNGKGSVTFICKNGEEKLLKEVYYIPTLCNNIVSLGKLSEDGNKVIMKGDYLWVYNEHRRLVMKVQKSANRLYKMVIENREWEFLMSKTEETAQIWHARLGHVNYKALSLVHNDNMAYGLSKIVHPSDI